MLENVAAVVLDGVNPFELGVVCEVFGTDRSDDGLPVYDFAVASAEGPTLTARAGFAVQVEHGLERLGAGDLVAGPGCGCTGRARSGAAGVARPDRGAGLRPLRDAGLPARAARCPAQRGRPRGP